MAVIAFILFPIRSIINKVFKDGILDMMGEVDYNDVFDKFNYDYDRENPVTKKDGFMRLINQKMKL